MATNSLIEVTHVDPAAATGRNQDVLTLQTRLSSLLQRDDLPPLVEVPLGPPELELVILALDSCIEYFGHWDSWDFPVRMGGWPAEAKNFLAKLKSC
jgi:hypothetical protein